jgi:CCR4-NOT transcription complex subunit 2
MFGHPQQQQQQQGSGDLLLGGRGGFDISITNGFGNEAIAPGNSGSSSAPSGQGGLPTFDLSDFPSLGGTPAAAGASGGENSSLANALRQQQQQILAQQQQLMQGQNNSNHSSSGISIGAKGNDFSRLVMGTSMANALGSAGGPNFKMATEDFPALPGAPLGGSIGNSGSSLLGRSESGQVGGSSPANLSFSGNPGLSITRSSSNVSSGQFGGELDGFTNQFDSSVSSLFGGVGSGVGNLVNQTSSNPVISQQRPTTSMTSTTTAPTGAPASKAGNPPGGAGSALSGDYGLLGLLKIIRLSDADRNALAVGSDLTSLGLNLNSSDNLFNTFLSPWSDSPASREPHYQVSCDTVMYACSIVYVFCFSNRCKRCFSQLAFWHHD